MLNEKSLSSSMNLINFCKKNKGDFISGNKVYELMDGNWKIKEFNFEEKLIFEGEYLKGVKNRKC